MINKVRRTIEKYSMLKVGDKVVVGVSGGADSMSLLSILFSLKDELKIDLIAVHINHGIRGEEAARDENFVSDYCREKNIELIICSENIPEIAKETGESEEECGRRIRYERFADVCKDGVIATAHTLSDSLETMIFNMLRGCTAAGLCGIPAKRDNIIRPLISCTRREIEDFCSEYNIPYVIDSTNLQSDYSRNFIRNELMPMFSRINPSYASALERCQNSLKEDNIFFEELTKNLYETVYSDNSLDIEKLNNLDYAVKSRIIYKYISDKTRVLPENKHISLVLSLLEKDGALQINSDFCIVSRNGRLFAEDKSIVSLSKAWSLKAAEGVIDTPMGKIKLTVIDEENINFNKILVNNILESYIDYDKICGDVVVRSRMEGDRITLPSRNVTKTLKKLFIEMKIPVEQRNNIPVIADDEKVLWVWGIGYNKVCSVDKKTKRVLKIFGG